MPVTASPGLCSKKNSANRICFRDAIYGLPGPEECQLTHVSLRRGPTWGLNHAANAFATSRIGFRWESFGLPMLFPWNVNETSRDFCQSEELPPGRKCKIYGYGLRRLGLVETDATEMTQRKVAGAWS